MRELVNVVERAVSFSDSEVIQPDDLPEHIRDARPRTMRPHTAESIYAHGGGNTPMPTLEAPRPSAELIGGDVTFKDAKERWVSSFERDYIVSLEAPTTWLALNTTSVKASRPHDAASIRNATSLCLR